MLIFPQVRESLGLSFDNVRTLHQNVDSIPDRGGQWYKKKLIFDDCPEQVHVIRHRNVIAAIRSLWGDPALAEYLVYKPKKIFSDGERRNRVYSEMWTGQWWHSVQVRASVKSHEVSI